jgi:hypothetical protein
MDPTGLEIPPLEALTLTQFVESAVSAMTALGETARDMDGRAAFLLGAASWFLVEQAVRRLAGLLRWAILGAVLAGGGVAAAGALDLLGSGGAAVPASQVQPHSLRPH